MLLEICSVVWKIYLIYIAHKVIVMKLFYAAGASSMASHILLIESCLPFVAERVDLLKKEWSGGDYAKITPSHMFQR